MDAAFVFSETLFTGQLYTADERLVCPVCNDMDNLLHLRYNAWYDPYLMRENGEMGKYVHYGCLSERRAAEVKADGY